MLLVERQTLRVTCAPGIDDRDIGLDPGQVGTQIVADAEAGRQFLTPAPGAGRSAPARERPAGDSGARHRPADAGIEFGDFQEAALIGGAGFHASNLPRSPRRRSTGGAGARRADGGPCRDRTDDIHGVNVALYQLS